MLIAAIYELPTLAQQYPVHVFTHSMCIFTITPQGCYRVHIRWSLNIRYGFFLFIFAALGLPLATHGLSSYVIRG